MTHVYDSIVDELVLVIQPFGEYLFRVSFCNEKVIEPCLHKSTGDFDIAIIFLNKIESLG